MRIFRWGRSGQLSGLEILKGTDIVLAGAIDFPEGVMSLEEKMKDFEKMAAMGVPEIDYVLNQKAVESRDFETIEKEMTTFLGKIAGKIILTK